ncbi:hypothetical protein D3C81_1958920 [compost metagenome]
MLLAYLGLQVAAMAGLGGGHELVFVGLERSRQGAVLVVLGHLQQTFFDDCVQFRVGREVNGVDIDQRAIGRVATGLDVLPAVALDLQWRAHVGLEQALTSAQDQGQHGHGS